MSWKLEYIDGPIFKPTFLPMAKLLEENWWENPYVFRSLFILKIPYLLLDIATESS